MICTGGKVAPRSLFPSCPVYVLQCLEAGEWEAAKTHVGNALAVVAEDVSDPAAELKAKTMAALSEIPCLCVHGIVLLLTRLCGLCLASPRADWPKGKPGGCAQNCENDPNQVRVALFGVLVYLAVYV